MSFYINFKINADDEIMGYFRSIVKSEEISERVFELTGIVID
jgi:hypothetical protein